MPESVRHSTTSAPRPRGQGGVRRDGGRGAGLDLPLYVKRLIVGRQCAQKHEARYHTSVTTQRFTVLAFPMTRWYEALSTGRGDEREPLAAAALAVPGRTYVPSPLERAPVGYSVFLASGESQCPCQGWPGRGWKSEDVHIEGCCAPDTRQVSSRYHAMVVSFKQSASPSVLAVSPVAMAKSLCPGAAAPNDMEWSGSVPDNVSSRKIQDTIVEHVHGSHQ